MTVATTTTYSDQSATMLPLAIPEEPSEPFGVIALPDPNALVSDLGVQRAYAAMLAHYRVTADAAQRDKDTRPIGKQIDKALGIAQNRSRWALHEDYVEIVGSAGDRYRVTPAFCEGSAWSNGGRRTNACKGAMRAAVGMCAHQIAIELLRLAQQLDPPIMALTVVDDPEPEAASEVAPREILAVALPGWAVFALCGAIIIKQKKLAAEDVSFLISPEDGVVCVSSGAYHGSVPATPTVGAIVVLDADTFQMLWDGVRIAAMDADSINLTLAVNEDTSGTLTLAGERVKAVVPCMAML